MRIYTRQGDDGTTGLYFGGRVPKDSGQIAVNGAVDEAQANLGWARALAEKPSRVEEMLTVVERDLWVLMSEVATAPENRRKLKPGQTLVTPEMVQGLEAMIDELSEKTEMPKDFVIPGDTQLSAALDVARTVVRRAERAAVALHEDGSDVVSYLNRLSDLVWTMARFVEGSTHHLARQRN